MSRRKREGMGRNTGLGWAAAVGLCLALSGCGGGDKSEGEAVDAGYWGDGSGPGEACTFASDCKQGLVCKASKCALPQTDAGGGAPDTVAQGGDVPINLDGYVNSWVRGYSIELQFHGGPADGDHLIFHRDLYEIPQAFSFGSTHYTQGEVGLAVADTIKTFLPDDKGKLVETMIEIWMNFGLVVGSPINPVHTDKAGSYPFSCKPPMLRIFFKGFAYQSTCPKLNGVIEIDEYGNDTGQRMGGHFLGRLQSYFKKTAFPNDCDATHTAETCKKADWYVDVKGYFRFELPGKDGKEGP